MAILTNSCLLDLLSIVTAIIIVVISYLKYKHSYYSKKGLYTPEPHLFYGNSKKMMRKQQSLGQFWAETYQLLKKKGLKHGGAYMATKPFYVPVDLEIVKHVLQNDFSHFNGHGFHVDEKKDPLTGHLFFLSGDKWKNLRAKLTPTFTTGKMKMMFNTLAERTEGLKELLDEAASNDKPVHIKEILERFTIDIIGTCAFGIDCNSMKNPDSEFAKYGRKIFKPTAKQLLALVLEFCLPAQIAAKFKSKDNEVTDFFMNLTKETIEYREKNNIHRNDFMHLLLQIKNKGKVTDDNSIFDESGKKQDGMTLGEMAAQVFVFFLGGFETSSSTMTFALSELAQHPEILKKVREEIDTVMENHNNKLTYEAINEMKYMDKVLEETLRKHPIVPFLARECSEEYTVPGTDVVIEKGEHVSISTFGIHHDPEIYPDPEKFDPERFSDENKAKRHQFAWLPFGAGPRICIGMRFGLMQTKVGLTTVIKNYDISLSEKTHTPIKYEPKGFNLSIFEDLWLDIAKR